MGSGGWSSNTYAAREATLRSAGKSSFDYSDTTVATTPRSTWKVNERLDPKRVNQNGPFAGRITREAADSDEHPNSTPIAVLFDVTASMGNIPRVLQQKLPELHGLLQRKGYVEDPQILFGGIGDAFSDRVPLQVGQFESDNSMDEDLGAILLEGGGGGGNHESYALGAYFLAKHTHLDSFEKRGKKGYAFLIGDERLYESVTRKEIQDFVGVDEQSDLSTEDVFEELKKRYEVFFLFCEEGSYREESVLPESASADWGGRALGWRKVLGQNALILSDANAVCETIALTLGVMEGTVTYEDGLEDLEEVSSDLSAVRAAGKALAKVGEGRVPVATATGALPDVHEEPLAGDEGADRL